MNRFDEIVMELYNVSGLVDTLAAKVSSDLDASEDQSNLDGLENALYAVGSQIKRISRELMEYDLVD